MIGFLQMPARCARVYRQLAELYAENVRLDIVLGADELRVLDARGFPMHGAIAARTERYRRAAEADAVMYAAGLVYVDTHALRLEGVRFPAPLVRWDGEGTRDITIGIRYVRSDDAARREFPPLAFTVRQAALGEAAFTHARRLGSAQGVHPFTQGGRHAPR